MTVTVIKISEEYASLVPDLSVDEYESTKQSIKQNGLWYPIVVNKDGIILDGHHRYKICQDLGINEQLIKTVTKDFPDKLHEQMFVIDSNLQRRHLNNFQRAELALKSKSILKEIAKANMSLGGKGKGKGNGKGSKYLERLLLLLPEKGVNEEIGKRAGGISHETVRKVETLIDKAPDRVIQALRTGHISISQAFEEYGGGDDSSSSSKGRNRIVGGGGAFAETQYNIIINNNDLLFFKNINKIICGDALQVLKTFPNECIDCCVTSPPYWKLRDYQVSGQLGKERTYTEYIDKLVEIFTEVKRVLKSTGSCWIVISDSYDDYKSLVGIPERLITAMIDGGRKEGKEEGKWALRNKIIWWKRNATPSSAKDRFTTDWEYLLFFVKSADSYSFKTQYEPHNPKYELRYKIPFGGSKNKSGQGAFDYIRPRFMKQNPLGRIKRCVWDIPIQNYRDAHCAVYPTELVKIPILATCPQGGIVLDPFVGSGTTAFVALNNARRFIGIDLNQKYVDLVYKRLLHTKSTTTTGGL